MDEFVNRLQQGAQKGVQKVKGAIKKGVQRLVPQTQAQTKTWQAPPGDPYNQTLPMGSPIQNSYTGNPGLANGMGSGSDYSGRGWGVALQTPGGIKYTAHQTPNSKSNIDVGEQFPGGLTEQQVMEIQNHYNSTPYPNVFGALGTGYNPMVGSIVNSSPTEPSWLNQSQWYSGGKPNPFTNIWENKKKSPYANYGKPGYTGPTSMAKQKPLAKGSSKGVVNGNLA